MNRLFPALCVFSCLIAAQSFAGSATWSANPVSSDWNTAANWTPNTVPNGREDIATFGFSTIANISVSARTKIASLIFNSDATAYLIAIQGAIPLTVRDFGITNTSQIVQTVLCKADPSGDAAIIQFINEASVNGPITFITEGNSVVTFGNGGYVAFNESSTATQCTFLNHGATVRNAFGGQLALTGTAKLIDCQITTEPGTVTGAFAGSTTFDDTSSADGSFFTSQGATISGGLGGTTSLSGLATAGDSMFISEGATVTGGAGGLTLFDYSANAGNSTLIATSGTDGGDGGRIHPRGFGRDWD